MDLKLFEDSKSLLLASCVFAVIMAAFAPCANADMNFFADQPGIWTNLEEGLDFAEFQSPDGMGKIYVLRIDPQNYEFVLGSAGMEGQSARTLGQWTQDHDLIATINASMYLPDGVTSTGYMRSGDYVNNERISSRFGAFFLAGPKMPGLPGAQIIEKDAPGWEEKLKKYDTVIQNYRMTNSDRRILWSPGGPLYSISAVAATSDGKILFLHAEKPVEAYEFVQHILNLPLEARIIMYVEGGAQAGLAINTPKLKKIFAAPHAPSLLITGRINASLPNVIGIKRKSR